MSGISNARETKTGYLLQEKLRELRLCYTCELFGDTEGALELTRIVSGIVKGGVCIDGF